MSLEGQPLLGPRGATLRPCRAVLRVNMDALHRRQVDHQPASNQSRTLVDQAVIGPADCRDGINRFVVGQVVYVTADSEALHFRKGFARPGYAPVGVSRLHPFTNHDEVVALPAGRKAGVVMHPSCLLVSRVGGPEKLTRERAGEFGDGFGDGWYRRHSVLSFLAPNVFHLAAEEANA